MRRTVLLASLMCWGGAVMAAMPPPVPPLTEISWKAASREAPSEGFALGSAIVRFEKTTLGEIAAAVSEGVIDHQGDAGESEYWLCYSRPREGQRIWIVSSGEMGGADHLVTGFVAEQLPAVAGTTDCPALPATTAVVLSGHKGWLGMSTMDVRKHFGVPSHESGAWQAFNYAEKLEGVCDGAGDRTNWLLIKQADGRVQTIVAGQVTSC
ncbi:hypothetical protein [Dyella silvatica]|uniref:hypothetical protein n=1 Tax=Dyella silvatica TaxID=2992128 RepID=UPI00224D1E2A|nr:hypothetical protein [Dyella silvatica]